MVVGGTLHDPYTSAVIPFSKTNAAAVQIDHVYPLARAFDMGAAGWSQERRTEFANDTGLELLAVDGRANRAKGDSGPAEWLPPNPAETCGGTSMSPPRTSSQSLPPSTTSLPGYSPVAADRRRR